MRDGELYAMKDLVKGSGLYEAQVILVVDFLRRYDFIEQISRRRQIFKKRSGIPSPDDTKTILLSLLR